jgi:GrpB-like predicted nucleotidyltransferase (UPF0157 family)
VTTNNDRTTVVVVPFDPSWAETFAAVASEIHELLGTEAREIVHIGSTAVPGLAAKPIIDIVLTVDDSANEASYRDALLTHGFRHAVREPEWFEHRMFQRDDPAVNLHVYSVGCEAVDRVMRFRDWLRTHPDDRELYAITKQRLATRAWTSVQDYADAKDAVVAAIMGRADAGPEAGA